MGFAGLIKRGKAEEFGTEIEWKGRFDLLAKYLDLRMDEEAREHVVGLVDKFSMNKELKKSDSPFAASRSTRSTCTFQL